MTRPATRSGRRPGDTGTREAILEAARQRFGEGGFDHATIRDIAARAGVDPALVHHYFGSKEQLFETALVLPVEPADFFPPLLRSGRPDVGAQIVRKFLLTWEDPGNWPVFMAMLRSVVSNEHAAGLVREMLTRRVFTPLAAVMNVEDARLRANLVGSQLIGLAMARYVGKVEPLASADVDTVAAAVGPTIQRYVTEDLSRR